MRKAITVCTGLLLCLCLALASEEAPDFHKKWMKESGDAMGNLRKGIDVEQSALKIGAIYKEVEGFWAKRNSEVGVKACKDAQTTAAELAAAARAGNKEGVAANSKLLGASCKSCHDTHREKVSETEYRIK